MEALRLATVRNVTTAGNPSAIDRRRERVAWLVVGVSWGGYFLIRAAGAAEWIQHAAKWVLMPALLLWVLVALGSAAPRWLVAGLVFATVGDIAILYVFEFGILGFLVMQICYSVGFLGLGAVEGLRRHWSAILVYAAIWLGVNIGLGPQFGDLRIPVLVYSLAICIMAALATGVSTRVGIGAALFLVSDMLLAFGEAGIDFAGRSAIIMPTYLAAQYLIATGWARRIDPDVLVPV
jgi:uncharacterized membrane protein YhhN